MGKHTLQRLLPGFFHLVRIVELGNHFDSAHGQPYRAIFRPVMPLKILAALADEKRNIA